MDVLSMFSPLGGLPGGIIRSPGGRVAAVKHMKQKSGSAPARMHRPALRAGSQLFARVELLEKRWQVAHDALQLHLDAVQQRVALPAIPLEAVLHAFGP